MNFNIIKWNARTAYPELQRRGIYHEGINGSYWADVKFTANTPGFVVQHIVKKYISNNFCSAKNSDYWEIFYIDESGLSYNADGFVQGHKGNKSSGETIQVGESRFYPYDKKVSFDNNGDMILTSKLKKIFGSHITINGHPNANGLPSGNKMPFMNTLVYTGNVIIHIVNAKWEPRNGENYTNISEEVYINDKSKSLNRPEEYIEELLEANMN